MARGRCHRLDPMVPHQPFLSSVWEREEVSWTQPLWAFEIRMVERKGGKLSEKGIKQEKYEMRNRKMRNRKNR